MSANSWEPQRASEKFCVLQRSSAIFKAVQQTSEKVRQTSGKFGDLQGSSVKVSDAMGSLSNVRKVLQCQRIQRIPRNFNELIELQQTQGTSAKINDLYGSQATFMRL